MSEHDVDPARPEDEVGAESVADQPTVEQAALEAAAAEQAAYAQAAGEPVVAEPVYEETVFAEPVAAEPAPEPTPVVGVADATAQRPAGTAYPHHAPPAPIGEERPEILVGAAFGGGLIAAMLLKGMARRKHR